MRMSVPVEIHVKILISLPVRTQRERLPVSVFKELPVMTPQGFVMVGYVLLLLRGLAEVFNTGRAWLMWSLSLAGICFELSGNSN